MGAAVRRRVDAAEDLFQLRCEELVGGVGRPDEEEAAGAEDVKGLLDDVDLQLAFAAAGWQILTIKYGRLLEELFTRRGGAALRSRIDKMPNPEYQRLLRCDAVQLRERLQGDSPEITGLLAEVDDERLLEAIRNLAGHDPDALDAAFQAIDDSRPTVIFAYTVKGRGLPTEGHPQNHSALLTDHQFRELATALGVDADQPWARFPSESPEAELCAATARRLRRADATLIPPPPIPTDIGRTPAGTATTQAALGRVLLDLLGARLATRSEMSASAQPFAELYGLPDASGEKLTTYLMHLVGWLGDQSPRVA